MDRGLTGFDLLNFAEHVPISGKRVKDQVDFTVQPLFRLVGGQGRPLNKLRPASGYSECPKFLVIERINAVGYGLSKFCGRKLVYERLEVAHGSGGGAGIDPSRPDFTHSMRHYAIAGFLPIKFNAIFGEIRPYLRLPDSARDRVILSGGLSGAGRGPGSPGSESQRRQYSDETEAAQNRLEVRPPNSVNGGLRHSALFAEIGLIVFFGLATSGFINGGIGLLLLGNNHGFRILGRWGRPRLIGGLALLLGLGSGAGGVWLCLTWA
jgi:hypothetical protein